MTPATARAACAAPQATLRREEEEEEAERLYEEAVGESKGLREIPQTREETG